MLGPFGLKRNMSGFGFDTHNLARACAPWEVFFRATVGVVEIVRVFGLKHNQSVSSSESLSVLQHKPGN